VTAANVATGANAANGATSANTASKIVARDASGNFSAGIITANLAGNATTATTAANVTGNIADTQLSSNVPLLDGTNLFTGTNNFSGVTLAINSRNVIYGGFVGNGGALTNLNASQLVSGTVPVAQLPVATTSALGVVQPDGATVTVSAGVISAPPQTITYITNGMADSQGFSYIIPHGLGAIPGFIHPILLCTTNDVGTGFLAGQMTEFTSVLPNTFIGGTPPFTSVSYDTTNLYITTTASPADDYVVLAYGRVISSWNNFAIVVGYHK
jgi:hypothetical protein